MSTPDLATLAIDDLGPFAKLLGLRVTGASRDEVRATWLVTADLLQPYGVLHGGAHCGVVETLASVAAALWLGPQGQVYGTTNSTDFYRPTTLGAELTSVARPVHRGRTRQVWRVETFDDQDRLVAAGQVAIHNAVR